MFDNFILKINTKNNLKYFDKTINKININLLKLNKRL